MSTWSRLKLNEKQRQSTQVTVKKEEHRHYLSTRKVSRLNKPTTIKINLMHNAFIEVETMRPYVPIRNRTSKRISHSRLNELRHKITRSRLSTLKQFVPNKQIRTLSAPVSTAHKLVSHLNIKQSPSPNLLKDQIKRKRILTVLPTSYPLQKLISVQPKRPQRRNNNSTLLTNGKQVLTRLEQLESDLKKIKRVVKNDTEVINHLKSEVLEKEKKLPESMIRKKNSSSTVIPSVENAQSEKKGIKSVDNIKARMNPDDNSIKNNTKSEDMHDLSEVRRNKNIDEKVNKNMDKITKNDKIEKKQDFNKGGPNQAVNYRRKYKDFGNINNKDEEKDYNFSVDEFSWIHNKKSNIMMNKRLIEEKKGFGNNKRKDIRNIDHITKDPLAYDSLDVRLEHDSNIQEFIKLKNENAIPTYKPYVKEKSNIESRRANKEAETNFPLYDDNSRRDGRLFAPPPGFKETNLESTKNNNNDQEAYDDVLKKIINAPSVDVTPKKDRNTFEIDDTEALGRKMLERLDLPGLKIGIENTIPNNDFYKFDHVKYVDSVMGRTVLPLYERRNIVKKSLDKRLNELYKKHNLKPKSFTKDDLDDVLKSMGATIHK
ncbi:unnamed protein product [Arctia plantaginis]|uniref:Uncharacterized protein n=1 Tax=Arctia plantaginis TaxID=874455 RepID=A0A8S1B3P2_ARCPL|nr:unnamed protein product [Arctia plantaginis]